MSADALLSNVIELIRYKIVSYVNTGDKVVDNLLCLTLMCVITLSIKYLKDFVAVIKSSRCCRKTNKFIITDFTSIDRNKHIQSFMIVTYFLKPESVETLCKWIFRTYPQEDYGRKRVLALNDLRYSTEDVETYTSKSYKQFSFFPIYQLEDDILYSHFKTQDGVFYLYCNKLATLKHFLNMFHDKVQATVVHKKDMQIFEIGEEDEFVSLTTINSGKTFDNMVFNKKQDILEILKEFEFNMKSSNIFLPKNLGILLHGPPGTGKTMFIKAVCNYFKKDAVIIDFTKIKTKSSLAKIVKSAVENKNIIVFDEFDLILKTLDQRFDIESLGNIENTLKICKDEKLVGELQKKYIDKVVSSNDDKITIYSLLTLLDGMCEHTGRIIIATTNSPDNINKALIRPGRFDIKLELGYFDSAEIKELLCKIFEISADKVESYKFPEHVWSPIEIITTANSLKKLDKTIDFLLKGK